MHAVYSSNIVISDRVNINCTEILKLWKMQLLSRDSDFLQNGRQIQREYARTELTSTFFLC